MGTSKNFLFLNDDDETKFHFVPKLFEDWPDYPTPEIVGFIAIAHSYQKWNPPGLNLCYCQLLGAV